MTDARAHPLISGDVQNVHFGDNTHTHETARAHDAEGWYGPPVTAA